MDYLLLPVVDFNLYYSSSVLLWSHLVVKLLPMNFSKILQKGKSKSKKDKTSPLRLALGLTLVLIGLVIILGRDNLPTIYSTSFESEPVKIEGLSFSELKEEKIPKRIVIPQIFTDLEVKKSNIVGGYWEVFEDTAGWGIGSGIPGEKGNQVIFAHAKEGLFLPLRSIKVGSQIYVLTDSDWYKYEIKEIKEVYPNQVEVIAPTEDETLTLYTCSGFADTKRLIVVAKPS